jgi:chaperonin cofactor prefoldin
MVRKRDLVIAVLITFCLTAMLFSVRFTRSQIPGQYDPWLDVNDDGKILIEDVAWVAKAFGASGDPVNKTALLYNVNDTFTSLLAKIDSLNSSLSELQSSINELKTTIVTMNGTITQLQNSNADLNNRVGILEGNFSTLLNRIDSLEANYSVTNLKLAPYAVPFNSTYSNTYGWTTEQYDNWVDMPYMSVTLNLSRASQFIIMFSGELQNLGPDTTRENTWICIRAMINNTVALPSEFNTTSVDPSGTGMLMQSHYLRWGTYNFMFTTQKLDAGFYTIKLQWDCTVGKAEVRSRDLVVIALPA